MHIRREFDEVAKLDPMRTAVAIQFFMAIYSLENDDKEHKLSADEWSGDDAPAAVEARFSRRTLARHHLTSHVQNNQP